MKSSLLILIFIFFGHPARGAEPLPPPIKIVILGDSLTEGYGLSKEQAFPHLVEKKFLEKKKPVEIINAGVSGSTSSGGLARVAWTLKSKPQFVLVALGANDGLRGLSLAELEKNLREIIQKVRAGGAKPLIAGMKMPPNYGAAYTKQFEQVYKDIAKKEKVPLLPFLLEGVASQTKLNLPDGIHPNEEGHKILAATIYQFLEKNL
jgi:acyl-CoA thioesterase-1